MDIEFINGRRTLVIWPGDPAIEALEFIAMSRTMSILSGENALGVNGNTLASAVNLPSKQAVDQLRFFGLVEVHHRSKLMSDRFSRLYWFQEIRLTDLGQEVLEMAQEPSDDEIHVPA